MLPTGALILAAGLGTRLRPLTRDRAKPALPVAGPTLIERTVAWLAGQGVHRLLVNLHHRPDTITSLLGDGGPCGVEVRYSWEVPILGSGGGPRRAFSLTTDDRLWLVNGDTLTDLELAVMAADHDRSGALVTMAVVPNAAPARYGGALVAGDGAVTGFTRRGDATPSWLFIGVQLVDRGAFDEVADGVPTESVGAVYPRLIDGRPGSVRAFRCSASFRDIGTPADYLTTCLALAPDRAALVGARCRLDATARVTETVLWDDVTIARDVVLHRSVVADGVAVPAGFKARESVIMRDSDWPLAAGEHRDAGMRVTPFPAGGAA